MTRQFKKQIFSLLSETFGASIQSYIKMLHRAQQRVPSSIHSTRSQPMQLFLCNDFFQC